MFVTSQQYRSGFLRLFKLRKLVNELRFWTIDGGVRCESAWLGAFDGRVHRSRRETALMGGANLVPMYSTVAYLNTRVNRQDDIHGLEQL